jgi:hypothetical protein
MVGSWHSPISGITYSLTKEKGSKQWDHSEINKVMFESSSFLKNWSLGIVSKNYMETFGDKFPKN